MDRQPVTPEVLHRLQELPVVDRAAEFQEIAKKQRVSEKEKEAFLRAKSRLAKSLSHLGDKELRTALENIRSDRGFDFTKEHEQPPGGVGFGVFYKAGQLSFSDSTEIRKRVIYPSQAGGDLSDYLYLTSTNRSAKGVEAYISHYKQENAAFKVFDWAKSGDGRFALTIDGSLLDHFNVSYQLGSTSLNSVAVVNSTLRLNGNNWRNLVQLLSIHPVMHVETVYSFDYTVGSDADQHSAYNGSWGPIVETFQQFHQDMNPMGYDGVYLQQDGAEHDLGASNTDLRDDGVGITVISQDGERSFMVK
jgi:hypothetical protein